MIKRSNSGVSGSENPFYMPKQVSTAFAKGTLVRGGGTGGSFRPAINTTTKAIGLVTKVIAATDADYTASTQVAVDRITNADQLDFDVTVGTASSANVGLTYDLNGTGDGVDLTSSANGQVLVIKVLSTTKVQGFLVA